MKEGRGTRILIQAKPKRQKEERNRNVERRFERGSHKRISQLKGKKKDPRGRKVTSEKI